jgi:RNA polymerase sigma factor (TIGR02999 family)
VAGDDSGATTRQKARAEVTALVAGDREAAERLLLLVYDDLRGIAARLLKVERTGHTLQPTALVHEAWLRLAFEPGDAWTDAAHFKAVAVRAMRRILVDHARQRGADKRPGNLQRVTLTGIQAAAAEEEACIDLLDLDRALERLEALHERQARVVELRCLGGLTIAEIAHVLGVVPSTVNADWAMARAFLRQELDAR